LEWRGELLTASRPLSREFASFFMLGDYMETKSKTRKIIKAGAGYVVTLPIEFIRKAGLKKGDEIGMVYDSFLVIISPRNKPNREV
jgi:hypothetical protein